MQEHTVKAVVYDRCSSVDVLQAPEIDQPVDGDDQVLVWVRVAQPSGGGCRAVAEQHAGGWLV